MNTQTDLPSPRQLPVPAVLLSCRLLSETCSVTLPMTSHDLTKEPHTLRATTVSSLLEEILTQTGYRHGGIND